MSKKNLLIYGWRGINQSVALVNQNQLLCLQRYSDLQIFHVDAPFHNPNWNSQNNASGFDNEQQTLINQPSSPTQDLTLDCIYTATFPFDIFHNLSSFNKAKSKRILNFIVTEFGISDLDFVFINGNPRNLLRDEDYIISPSNWSRNKTIEYGFPENRIKIIPHGIDPQMYFPPNQETRNRLKTNLGLHTNDYLFVNMGSMTWNKGIDLILEAFLILKTKYDHIKLLLKDQSNLYGIQSQNVVSNLLLDKPHLNKKELLSGIILVTNNLTQNQLKDIYSSCDCYLSPYRAEGFNLTVLEALACGTDVIVTEGGATDDFCLHPSIGKVSSKKISCSELRQVKKPSTGYYLEPDLESLIEQMEIKISQGSQINFETSKKIRDEFTWQRAAKELYELM